MKHCMTGTRLYRIWKTMRTRCNNQHAKSYHDYGGRGIKICEDWDTFENFYEWSMSNGYSDNLTIDRIDVDGMYCPDNCRWISRGDQNRNRRNNIKLLYAGRTYTPVELSEMLGISINTIYDAHRNRGLVDFSNYKPRHSQIRNITRRHNGYELTIKGKYMGKFKTVEEAIEAKRLITT